MPWVRFDDQFPIHRKVDGLSDAAYRLHTSAIFWSARNLTDGFVSREDLDGVTARVRTPARFAAECVKRELWHDARQDCPSEYCPGPVDEDGWVIHDYWDYQPSKEQVIHNREADRLRQKRHRDGRHGVSHGVTHGVSPAAPARPDLINGSVLTDGARASPAVQNPKPVSSMTNGAATRQPPPVAEAIARAMHPEDRRPPRGRHAKENP